jgi:ATP-binding cassette, subfamily C (CFTR/MRP), member 1
VSIKVIVPPCFLRFPNSTSFLLRIFEGIQEIHYLWGAPIEAAAILILLGTLVGLYCLPAVGVICMVVPAQYYFGYCIIKNKNINSKNTVERFSIVQVRAEV